MRSVHEHEIQTLRDSSRSETESLQSKRMSATHEPASHYQLEIQKLNSAYKDTVHYLKSVTSLEEPKAAKYEEVRRYEKRDTINNVQKGIKGETSVVHHLASSFKNMKLSIIRDLKVMVIYISISGI